MEYSSVKNVGRMADRLRSRRLRRKEQRTGTDNVPKGRRRDVSLSDET